jgi:imidazolonepropionase-like amidohydrolase
MRFISIIIAIIFSFPMLGQELPAPKQVKSIAIVNATIHQGNGKVINNGAIAFKEGKITFVGKNEDVNRQDYQEIIDASGKHVYPGFIATNTILGLVEVDAVRATRDFSETGTLNPNVRSIIAYNTDSKVIPTVRSNGVLIAQPTPRGGRISGSSSLVHLDAWNWEDALVKEDDGIHLNWPKVFNKSGWWAEPGAAKKNDKYEEQHQELIQFFEEARAYSKKDSSSIINLRFEALKGIFHGEKRLYVHANAAKEMLNIIKFKRRFDMEKVTIAGGEEALLVAESLRENNISIILQRSQSLPPRTEDDYDEVYTLPAKLMEKGLLVAMSGQGDMEAMNTRNLPFYAGSCVPYGLDKNLALQLITLNAATITGIDHMYGSLEQGKSATLFISAGDALEIIGNRLTHAFIDGRAISLDNHQIRLSERFKEKYKREEE